MALVWPKHGQSSAQRLQARASGSVAPTHTSHGLSACNLGSQKSMGSFCCRPENEMKPKQPSESQITTIGVKNVKNDLWNTAIHPNHPPNTQSEQSNSQTLGFISIVASNFPTAGPNFAPKVPKWPWFGPCGVRVHYEDSMLVPVALLS